MCTLKFNIVLAEDNEDEYMNQIIPHEVAHIISAIKYGYIIKGYRVTRKYGKVIKTPVYDSHGVYWQHVMWAMDKSPDRCHTLDVSKVKQKRTIRRHVYACPVCKKEYGVTSQKHTKICNSNGRVYPYCKVCDIEIKFTGEIRAFS
jgi:SprT protein